MPPPTGREVYPRLRLGSAASVTATTSASSRKPQALRQVADELIAKLGEPFATAWRHLVDEQGPKQAARAFAQVLKGLERHGERAPAERVRAALQRGEPLHLALVQPQEEVSVAMDALPPALQVVEVATSSAADFGSLLGGAQ